MKLTFFFELSSCVPSLFSLSKLCCVSDWIEWETMEVELEKRWKLNGLLAVNPRVCTDTCALTREPLRFFYLFHFLSFVLAFFLFSFCLFSCCFSSTFLLYFFIRSFQCFVFHYLSFPFFLSFSPFFLHLYFFLSFFLSFSPFFLHLYFYFLSLCASVLEGLSLCYSTFYPICIDIAEAKKNQPN